MDDFLGMDLAQHKSARKLKKVNTDSDTSEEDAPMRAPEKRKRVTEESSKSAKRSQSESAQHKQDLERLKQTDPEFYEFMQKEDQGLLEFSDEEEPEEDEQVDELEVCSF